MIVQIITKMSDKQWAERKKELRMLPKAEILSIAETEPKRTNDKELWKEWFPKIWLGVVEKFGGEAIDEPVKANIHATGNTMKDTMEELAISDKQYEPQTENL